MANQAVLPKQLGRVHPFRRTPWVAIVFTTLISFALITYVSFAGSDAIAEPGGTTSLLLLAVFTVVDIAVLVLRRPADRPASPVRTANGGRDGGHTARPFSRKDTEMSGRVVHFEIPFDDGERARAFYRDTFGWDVKEMPEFDYTMASSGPTSEQGMPSEPGFINGGMFRRSDAWPASGPVITVDVPSIDATLARISELGGATVVEKQAVGEMGFAAYFRDPEGNIVGLWENAASS